MAMTFRDELIHAIPELRRYARSLMRDRSQVEDLVQDTLERALTKQALYVDTGPLIRWLYTIMRNVFIDRTRNRKRRERVEGITLEEEEHPGAVRASQEEHRFLAELTQMLGRLPQDGGRIIMAVGVSGDGYRETANRLNLPRGTIASRLSRSRSALLLESLKSAPDPRLERAGRRSVSRGPCTRGSLAQAPREASDMVGRQTRLPLSSR